jgi:hypothetical protein
MTGVWSKEVAKRELVRKRLNAPRRVRRDPQLRDGLIAPMLDADMDRYVSRYAKCAPKTLQAYVKEVLVIRGPLGDPIQAMADALLPNARVITVTPKYSLAMHLTARAIVEVTPQVKDLLAPRLKLIDPLVPPVEALGTLASLVDALASEVICGTRLVLLIKALADLRADPASSFSGLEALRLEYEDRQAANLEQAGIHFTLGHELGHQLLNHGWNNPNDNHAPGTVELNVWLDSLGMRVPSGRRRAHAREHQADAMAVFLGATLSDHPSAVESTRDGRLTCAGAFLTTLTMWLVKENLEQENVLAPDTHPPVHQRNLFLMDLLSHTFSPLGNKIEGHPGLDRSPDNHPVGFSMQIWACCQVIAHLLDAHHLQNDFPE